MEELSVPARGFLQRYLRAAVGLAITAIFVALLILVVPGSAYLWIKAFHIIAMIAWISGMLYLPRLFVYHCDAEPGSRQSETLKLMERRLLYAIINPAMTATWVFGLWLAWQGGWFAAHWLHVKLLLVVALSGLHGLFARWVGAFAADRNRHSQNFYRIINEIPTVTVIAIVLLVVLKPF